MAVDVLIIYFSIFVFDKGVWKQTDRFVMVQYLFLVVNHDCVKLCHSYFFLL